MTWFAIARGALDLSFEGARFPGIDVALIPTVPSEPVGLAGEYAQFWTSLLGAGRDDSDLDAAERSLVREFRDAGIASESADDPFRLRGVSKPWLSSPVHELVYGLVASIVRECGARAVFVKGPALYRQGLRDREHSGDVDVWVEPAAVACVAEALAPWGWWEPELLWSGNPWFHSVTLRSDGWGCEIDIHRHMPGCALRDPELFDVLWSQTAPLCFASAAVLVPDTPAHAAIAALHALRPVRDASREQEVARTLEAAEFMRRGGRASVAWAAKARALAVLEPVVSGVYPDADYVIDYDVPDNWQRLNRTSRFAEVVDLVRLTPIGRLPYVAWRILWPTETDIIRSDLAAGGRGRNLVWARLRRFARIFRRGALFSRRQ